MATQQYEFIISAQARGFEQAASTVRTATSAIARDLESARATAAARSAKLTDLQDRQSAPRPSVFADIPAVTRGSGLDQTVLRATAREHDAVASAAVKARKAEMDLITAKRQLMAPFAKDYIKQADMGPVERQARLGAAYTKSNDTAAVHDRALKAETKALEAATVSAGRRALLGDQHARFLKTDGSLNFPARNDPLASSLRSAVSSTVKAADKEQASLLATRNALLRGDIAASIKETGARRREAAKEAARGTEQAYQEGLYKQISGVSHENVDPATRVGTAQTRVNNAERTLVDATMARTALLDSGRWTARQLQRSDKVLEAATASLASARIALAREESHTRSTSVLGRGRDSFMTGFKGASDRPYMEQMGQAVKFSVFYGTAYKLLFAFTTTLTATLQEGIAFQSAMTELRIASGASADAANEMAVGLGAQAVAAGQAPSAGIQIGARSLGLYGATESSGASQAEQQRVAETSVRTVSRMALGSDLPITELTTQLAAVANAFGTGSAGQIQAADLDAYLGRQFGVQQGQILQAVAESANVGQAAGFDQEQISSIAAALISRTGQTPSAVSGYMAQIFSRGGEGSLTEVTSKYGIDQTGELSVQIAELSRIYKDAGSAEQSAILASFGRGKVQNAAEVLVGGFDEIQTSADRAKSESGGAAEDVANLRLQDIGGQIQITVAAMKSFASELGRSGLLDVLGMGIIVFRELVEATTSVLRMWAQLPGPIKTLAAALLFAAAAARTNAGANALSSVTGAAKFGGLGEMAGKAAKTAGPIALAIGGLMAISSLKDSSDRMKAAQELATDALTSSGLTSTSTADEYRASAAELDQIATQNREAKGWASQAVTFGGADDENIALAKAAELEAERRRALADQIEARQSAISVGAPAISGFDATSLATSLDLITESGGTAETRLDALVDALHGTSDAAVEAAGAIGEDFAGTMATGIKDGISGIGIATPLQGLVDNILGSKAPKLRVAPSYEVAPAELQSPDSASPVFETRTLDQVYQASQSDIQARIEAQLAARDVTSLAQLDKTTAQFIADAVVEDADFDPDLNDEDLADARKKTTDFIRKQLMAEAKGWRKLLKINRDLTAAEVAAIVNSVNTEFDAALDMLPETDLGGRVQNRRSKLSELTRARGNTQAAELPSLLLAIASTRNEIAQSEIARIEQVRRVAQQNAKSGAEVAAAGRRAMRGRIAAAVANGNRDTLAAAILASGKGAIAIARAAIAQAIAVANAAIQMQSELAAAARELTGMGGLAGLVGVSDKTLTALDDIDRLNGLKSSLATAVVGDGKNDSEGADVAGPEKFFEEPKAGKSPEDRKAEREAARQEMLELKNNLYLLSIDLTDPLAAAVAGVKDARRRLASDISSGQDKNTVVASRLALRQAQNEREATAFQQRLDSVTTAEELGRISHQKYINYLQNERRRLDGIKNRTFQQQQQLDSIDRLMKDAADSMQGQWNFGDIKLPTPYQVRRQVEMRMDRAATQVESRNPSRSSQVESFRTDRATQMDATSRQVANNSTIYIDGADTGKVRQIIVETLGKSNATVTNRPRRR